MSCLEGTALRELLDLIVDRLLVANLPSDDAARLGTRDPAVPKRDKADIVACGGRLELLSSKKEGRATAKELDEAMNRIIVGIKSARLTVEEIKWD